MKEKKKHKSFWAKGKKNPWNTEEFVRECDKYTSVHWEWNRFFQKRTSSGTKPKTGLPDAVTDRRIRICQE